MCARAQNTSEHQESAELPRISIPRTSVNKLIGPGSRAPVLTTRARALRQVFREIHREFIAVV
jgi:hypothetical protein